MMSQRKYTEEGLKAHDRHLKTLTEWNQKLSETLVIVTDALTALYKRVAELEGRVRKLEMREQELIDYIRTN